MENADFAARQFQGSGSKHKARLLILAFCLLYVRFSFAESIKEPNVAGAFYPSDAKELAMLIDSYIEGVSPDPIDGDIFAVIVPHAGYVYSGKTAANAYKLIKGRDYKTVLVIGSSHHFPFQGVCVYPSGSFRTPLGDLEIDSDFAQQLTNGEDIVSRKEVFEKEHTVEVQLPFLQRVLGGIKIVPVLMGDCSLQTCRRFAEAIMSAVGERNDVLIVASTDMYHGYDYEACERMDKKTLSCLTTMDERKLYEGLTKGDFQLCGGLPVVTTLIVSKQAGHTTLIPLQYTNSALVTGNKTKGAWTVGYASCVIDQEKEGVQDMMFHEEQRKRLLELARNSIETYLRTGKKLEVSVDDPTLAKQMGAFVTLHENGELRGCIGNLVGQQPFYLTVRDMAVEAATNDPRFSSVKLSELDAIEIEISALSPLQRVKSSDEIRLGVHGVLVKKGFNTGVFLPQVADETGWTKEEFLSYLCSHKAGLPPDAWKDPSTELYTFTAEVFSETEK